MPELGGLCDGSSNAKVETFSQNFDGKNFDRKKADRNGWINTKEANSKA